MRNEISETLFKIHADYRKNNSVKNLYYVLASNKREAKKKFVNIITWLNVYSVEECSKEETSIILSEPNKHIIILY